MMSAARLLVVEDRDTLRRMLVRALEQQGYEVVEVADGLAAIERLGEDSFDMVLTDLKLPGASGLEVLAASRKAQPMTPVVVMTAYGTVETAVEAMRAGALDFVEKPVEIDDLYRVVARAVGESSDEQVFEVAGGQEIVGSHPRLRAALRLVEKVAKTDSTVLLTGESGTGKELFARAVHALSSRAAGPFVAVNCAAIPEALLENELFGHQKGAYTGADRAEKGRFEKAEGGTLLLDEIGELGLQVQSKVLRALEERTYERVGGGETRHADVRLVGTTNRDLESMVASGEFRSDLFYRLNVFPIELPPLRERLSDVPHLTRHLVARAAQRNDLPGLRISAGGLELLAEQAWPGNVRQLGNVVERAVILAERSRISRADLAMLLDPLDGDEESRLRAALEEVEGDKHRAAEVLGVSYRTLQRRIREFGLKGYPKYR
jgi:DNA-binding NtrC family response regulator